ncbi:MAG: hypothetical protein ACKO96_29030 [Flammeovirgaceae bacterium]
MSAFVKVNGTSTLVPIFTNYVDIAREYPIKYIYLQQTKNITVSLNWTGSGVTFSVADFLNYWTANANDTNQFKSTQGFIGYETTPTGYID